MQCVSCRKTALLRCCGHVSGEEVRKPGSGKSRRSSGEKKKKRGHLTCIGDRSVLHAMQVSRRVCPQAQARPAARTSTASPPTQRPYLASRRPRC